MSIEVPIPDLIAGIAEWGFGYLISVSDDERTHVLALRPAVLNEGGAALLRFDAGGGRACRNAVARPDVTLVFPPQRDGDGMSLIVDGRATVDGSFVDVAPTWAVKHRPAP